MKHDYKQLKVWLKARENNLKVYQITNQFPKEEMYGLTSQLRRSIISVSSNIAEGSAYSSNAQFTRFLEIALGSLCEAESQIYMAYDLNYIKSDNLNNILSDLTEQKKLIRGFQKSLKTINH